MYLRSLPLAGLPLILLFPFTLNSADIYVSSQWMVKIEANLNPYIVSDDAKLKNTILVVSAPKATRTIGFDMACEHTENELYRAAGKDDKDIFVIQLEVSDDCTSSDIMTSSNSNVFTDTKTRLSIQKKSDMAIHLMDYSTDELTYLMRDDYTQTRNLEDTTNAQSGQTLTPKLVYIRNLYKKAFLRTRSDLARSILDSRNGLRYISPVAGYSVPEKERLQPGAGRPYRKDTTDGIHHGWDVMAPYGTPVRALEKGIIIRVVSGWKWENFNQIKRKNLTEDDRLTNLDIFRGNQIWLKTMDGNVTFYSHLSRINPNITIGKEVEAGASLGAIGTSGVPDKNYRDIHLHFEIQQNPHTPKDEPTSHLDIMRWRYIGKWESRREVLSETKRIFRQ